MTGARDALVGVALAAPVGAVQRTPEPRIRDGGAFRTVYIRGREYVIVASPFLT